MRRRQSSSARLLKHPFAAAMLEFPRVLWESFLFFVVVVMVWAASTACIYLLVAKPESASKSLAGAVSYFRR